MNYIVSAFLIIVFVKFTQGENILTYGSCNGSSHYGGHSARCVICATPKECETPETVQCTSELAAATIGNISKVFPNAQPETKSSKHLVCFAIQAHNLNGDEIDIRGCMYYQAIRSDDPVLSYEFDFMPLYGKSKYRYMLYYYDNYTGAHFDRITKKNFESYNRTYWNITHFPDISCVQCEDDDCNEKISPYQGGKILFQRPYQSLKQWNCIKYIEVNKQAFHEKCKVDKVVGAEDKIDSRGEETNLKCGTEWDWPHIIYVPHISSPGWEKDD